MDVAEIIAELEYLGEAFPREAVAYAVANRDAVIPELLTVLEKYSDNVEELADDDEYMLHFYAMYLLAQFREQRAYPLIVRFFSGPGDAIDEAVGDVVTDDLCRILASVSCGDDSLIKSLIEDEEINEWVREAALRALVTLVACNEKPREEVVSYFRKLFTGRIKREYSQVWNGLVHCSKDLYPEELYQDIGQCYEDELVDPFFMDLDDVWEALDRGKEEALRRLKTDHSYTLITDTISEMEEWGCFNPQESSSETTAEEQKIIRSLLSSIPDVRRAEPVRSAKIGRNEPCPCGSGKKYKKCCWLKGDADPFARAAVRSSDDLDRLDALSNSVLDLVRSGRLAKGEEVCQQLLTRYPDQVDGLDRLAIVYEAKGDKAKAVEYYRKAADFMRSHPGFDEDGLASMLSEARRLEAEL
jgi:tetratricopeptide (TPR) repeat protein